MSAKRPLEDGVTGPAKKLKSDSSIPGTSTPNGSPLAPDYIAKKRAEVAAMMANFSAQRTAKPTVLPPLAPPKPQPVLAPLPASLPARPSTTAGNGSTSGIDPELAKKVAEAKKRAMASLQNKAISSNPYLSAAAAATKKKPGAPAPEILPQGAGLKMAAHPLLLDNTVPAATSNKDRYKPMQPKFASIKANARNQPSPTPPPPSAAAIEAKSNPYASGSGTSTPSGETDTFKDRTSRSFRFNQKGKYIALGSQLRQEAQLEELKQRIAESAKKAGLDAEFEKMEKNIRCDPPPDVEWWDAALLPSKSYSDITLDAVTGAPDLSKTLIRSSDSPITLYVQHPIPIPAPSDKNKVELKPLLLTKKEMKKMRRQRRQAELRDKQDRQRMGLIPPDPPKVRLANLMRVLTSDAVQDPTKVEAKVRREVAMRKKAHDQMNQDRKLTDEQRRERLETKKVDEERKGIFGVVFKIKTLTDPSHRFKVRKNAEQYGLTGICIFNPAFSLVVVEGSYKATRQYSRLMLGRIRWTEAARDKAADPEEDAEDGDDNVVTVKRENDFNGFGGGDEGASLDDNTCYKVWEGPLRDRVFKGFRAKSCPTDSTAKDALGEKMASYWDVAKSYVKEEDL